MLSQTAAVSCWPWHANSAARCSARHSARWACCSIKPRAARKIFASLGPGGKPRQLENLLEKLGDSGCRDRCVRIPRIDDHTEPFGLHPQLAVGRSVGRMIVLPEPRVTSRLIRLPMFVRRPGIATSGRRELAFLRIDGQRTAWLGEHRWGAGRFWRDCDRPERRDRSRRGIFPAGLPWAGAVGSMLVDVPGTSRR